MQNTGGVRALYLTLISAILCGMGVLVSEVWYASILGIALCIYTLHSLETSSWRTHLLLGALCGTTQVAVVLIWFWQILPLDWMDAGIVGSSLVLFLSWLFVAIALGSVFGLCWVAYKRFGSHSIWGSLFFASVWVLCEYAQMWIFAFLTWGVASAKSAHFSATFIGYSLASFSPLLQLSYIGGVYVLSFTTVLLGALVYRFLNSTIPSTKKILSALIVLCICVGVTTFDSYVSIIGTQKNSQDEITRVALVATQFSHKLMRDYESRQLRHEVQKELVVSALKDTSPVDLVIFPEGAANFPNGSTDVKKFLSEVFPEHKPSLIDSSVTFENNVRLQRMFYWSPEAELAGTYDKIFLVPQGEYTPNITYIVFHLLGMPEVVEKMKRVSPGFTQGSTVATTKVNGVSIGGLFCSDVLSPQLYRRLARDGADMLINPASHALFHSSPIVDSYILSISKVRAVENGKYVLIAGNGVPSSVISSSGEILMRSPKGESSVLVADIPHKQNLTPFTILGDQILWLPALFCLLYIDRRMIRARPH